MARIADLVPDVLIYAPGAPNILAEQKILDAAIELCNASGYWREQLDPMTAEAGKAQYDIDAPTGSVIKNIVTLSIDDEKPLSVTTMVELNRKRPGWRSHSGSPKHYVMANMREFILTPTPDKAYDISVFATLRPQPGADSIPDILADFLRDVIVDGAVFKLLSMPKRQWTDLNTAAIHRGEFYRGVKQARIDANKQYSVVQKFIQPRPFA